MNVSRKAAWLTRLVTACALALGLAGLFGTAASAASASTGTGYLRLAHLSPNTPAVDVYLYSFGDPSAMVVLHHVAYGDVSPYEAVASGEYTVAMRAMGAAPSSKPVLSTTIDVVSGHAYTVAGMGPCRGPAAAGDRRQPGDDPRRGAGAGDPGVDAPDLGSP